MILNFEYCKNLNKQPGGLFNFESFYQSADWMWNYEANTKKVCITRKF